MLAGLQRRAKSSAMSLDQLGEALEAKAPDQLRLLTLNVAHGRRQRSHQALVPNEATRRNLGAIADTLKQVGPDLVALQEADGPSAWSGNFDHVATLSELSELEEFFRGEHNPFSLGRYNLASGTALLARHPLEDPASHAFDAAWRDTKGFVVATVQVPEWQDLAVDVVSVHLDFLTPATRRRQLFRMIDTLEGRDNPVVVLGDLNCCWHREPHTLQLLSRTLGLKAHEPESDGPGLPTYPAARPRRRLDWILISDPLRFARYQTLPIPLSDHLGVLADLELEGGSREKGDNGDSDGAAGLS